MVNKCTVLFFRVNVVCVCIIGLFALLTGCAQSHAVKRPTGKIAIQMMRFPRSPERIVLLLPLRGKLAETGEAIRNGFLAAYYYGKKKNAHIANVTVIDTTSGPIRKLYRKASLADADVVIGPLLKRNVETIVHHLKKLKCA